MERNARRIQVEVEGHKGAKEGRDSYFFIFNFRNIETNY